MKKIEEKLQMFLLFLPLAWVGTWAYLGDCSPLEKPLDWAITLFVADLVCNALFGAGLVIVDGTDTKIKIEFEIGIKGLLKRIAITILVLLVATIVLLGKGW